MHPATHWDKTVAMQPILACNNSNKSSNYLKPLPQTKIWHVCFLTCLLHWTIVNHYESSGVSHFKIYHEFVQQHINTAVCTLNLSPHPLTMFSSLLLCKLCTRSTSRMDASDDQQKTGANNFQGNANETPHAPESPSSKGSLQLSLWKFNYRQMMQ